MFTIYVKKEQCCSTFIYLVYEIICNQHSTTITKVGLFSFTNMFLKFQIVKANDKFSLSPNGHGDQQIKVL